MIFRIICIICALSLVAPCSLAFENADDSVSISSLSVNVDATLFLRDDEFYTLSRGYTIPGFRLVPTIAYRHNSNIYMEVGAYLMHYWGANEYPNGSYIGIPEYYQENTVKGVHALPYLRAVMSTNSGLSFVLGDIYGGACHHMLKPLYTTEIDLTADPEAGFQVLFKKPWIDADAWIDWRTFIFENSPQHEIFYAGLSTRFNYTRKDAPLHIYSPLQLLVQHMGGEVNDDNEAPGIFTHFNGAVGLGVVKNLENKYLKSIGAEVDWLCSKQVVGDAWPYEKGWSVYARAMAKAGGFHADLGYYYAHDFITLLGLPLWGTVSAKHDYLVLKNPSTIVFSLQYSHEFSPGFTLSGDLQLFRLLSCDAKQSPDSNWATEPGTTSYSIGVTMRLSPSFLLRRWRQNSKP